MKLLFDENLSPRLPAPVCLPHWLPHWLTVFLVRSTSTKSS